MITLYVLKATNGKRYMGITNDLARRLKEHRSLRSKGSQVLGQFSAFHSECTHPLMLPGHQTPLSPGRQRNGYRCRNRDKLVKKVWISVNRHSSGGRHPVNLKELDAGMTNLGAFRDHQL